LRALGLRPRRGLSQSFLDDPALAEAIVRSAELDPLVDEVLEVGPGLVVLTERLVRAARRVVAIELDAQLADALREAGLERLEVHTADVLQTDIGALFSAPFVVVANLPYHITSPAIRYLLAARPKRLIVMVQREVGERITAGESELSSLAVSIQVQASVRVVRRVPKTAFYPSPKVDSVVLRLEPLTQPMVMPVDLPAFVRLVQAGFKQPRKQLGNSLAEGLELEKPRAVELLLASGIDPMRRPQELSIAEWVRLFEAQP
jgi:16S rRNA (adenine1518-N6/adenine1519-N6)-dimethyltransferase